MVIGLDFDSVLMDLYPALIGYHNTRFNTSYPYYSAINYRLEDLWGRNTEETDKIIVEFYNTDMHDKAKPMPGAQEAVRKLKQDNHKLFVVTSRPEFVREKTLAWIDRNFPNHFDRVYFTNLYLGKSNVKTKAQACKELGVDVFVDDFVSYATNAAENGIRTFLLDAPWNQAENLHPNITRVRDWNHILELLS